MSFTRQQFETEYRDSLLDAEKAFKADSATAFNRHIEAAIEHFEQMRPRVVITTLSLSEGQAYYTLPADFSRYHTNSWHDEYQRDILAPTPPVVFKRERNGEPTACLTPTPSREIIDCYGSAYEYSYFAQHRLSEQASETTFTPMDKPLLLLRCQAEAMKDLAVRNLDKPLRIRDGFSQTAKNGTPAALYKALLEEFSQQARHYG